LVLGRVGQKAGSITAHGLRYYEMVEGVYDRGYGIRFGTVALKEGCFQRKAASIWTCPAFLLSRLLGFDRASKAFGDAFLSFE